MEKVLGMAHVNARAMGVMDLPASLYAYSVPTLEDIILKIHGVRRVQINSISRKVTVEFDPSVTSFDRIRDMLRRKDRGQV